MDAFSGAWELLVGLLSQFRAFKVPILGVYLFELTNTLLGAQLLRQQLNYRVHWLRAFVLTVVAGVGGNSAASFFTGKTPRWINGAPLDSIAYQTGGSLWTDDVPPRTRSQIRRLFAR